METTSNLSTLMVLLKMSQAALEQEILSQPSLKLSNLSLPITAALLLLNRITSIHYRLLNITILLRGNNLYLNSLSLNKCLDHPSSHTSSSLYNIEVNKGFLINYATRLTTYHLHNNNNTVNRLSMPSLCINNQAALDKVFKWDKVYVPLEVEFNRLEEI